MFEITLVVPGGKPWAYDHLLCICIIVPYFSLEINKQVMGISGVYRTTEPTNWQVRNHQASCSYHCVYLYCSFTSKVIIMLLCQKASVVSFDVCSVVKYLQAHTTH